LNVRIEHELRSVGGHIHRISQGALESRLEGNAEQLVLGIEELARDGSRNGGSNQLAELIWVFDARPEIGHCLQDRNHIANRNALAEKVLKDLLDVAELQHPGD